jgi:hypothetical protein
MTTMWLLLAQYQGEMMIPVDRVAKDFFGIEDASGMPRFLRKLESGDIPLPLVRMEQSQKGAKRIDLRDLAAYLDERRAAAQKELRQICQ